MEIFYKSIFSVIVLVLFIRTMYKCYKIIEEHRVSFHNLVKENELLKQHPGRLEIEKLRSDLEYYKQLAETFEKGYDELKKKK